MSPTTKDSLQSPRSPRALTTRFVLTAFGCLLGLALGLALLAALLARQDIARRIPTELEAIAMRTAAQLDRDSADRLREIQTAANEALLWSSERTADWKRDQLESLRDRLALTWVGFAQENGTIVVASEGALERTPAFRFPWFRTGLSGPYVGEAHDVPELEQLAGAESQFVPYALPVKDAEGRVVGVLCGLLETSLYLVNAPPVPVANSRGLVISVYHGTGTHFVASDGYNNRPSLGGLLATASNRGYFREELSGVDTLTGFARCRPAPGTAGGNLVVVRQTATGVFSPAWNLGLQIALAGALLSVLLALPTVSIARRLRRTFHSVEVSAERIASGDPTAILPGGRDLNELQSMCEALNRMVEALRQRMRTAETRPSSEHPHATPPESEKPDTGPRKIYW